MTTASWQGSFDLQSAAHLWRRAGFGANRATLERSVRQGLEATLAEIFSQREHDPALLRGIDSLLALNEISNLQAWWIALILANRAPLVERVALFWHDHFATSYDKVEDVRLMHAQVELFRRLGLGDFRKLLHEISKDPAMLIWLDGIQNKKGQANENFAREVMELFALGIGHYTERDIQEAARAFTGWSVEGRRFVFREQYHDSGEKQVLGKRGHFGGEQVLDVILAEPACLRHIARDLLCEFVLPQPTTEEIEEWAEVLEQEEWNVERMLARLFRSELFFSPRARRSRIAGPIELLAQALIALHAKLAPAEVARAASTMGQALYRPPSVKGWDGGRTWIHAGTWIARHNWLTKLVYDKVDGRNALDLAVAYGPVSDRRELSLRALELLLAGVADPVLDATLFAAAESAQSEEAARARLTAILLTSPEYHLI